MFFIIVAVLWGLGILYAPFPHWPTYFLLWKNVLCHSDKSVFLKSRLYQAIKLLSYLIITPFLTFLWYIDDLFFPSYKQLSPHALFIIGQPRSGTTFFHRTLAADKETFFAVRHIEWRYPFIIFHKAVSFLGLNNMLNKINYWPNTVAGQKAANMHRDTLYDYEEDGIFFEERFLYHLFNIFRFPYPQLIPYLDNFTDLPEKTQQHIMLSHRKVIQKVMYLRGGKGIYLSKEVESLKKLPWILETYQDAKFIFLARKSSEFLNSVLLLIKTSTYIKTGVDTDYVPEFNKNFIALKQQDGDILIDFFQKKIPFEQQVRFSYDKITTNLIPSINHLYDRFGFELQPAYQQFLKQQQQHQEQRDRNYDYELKLFEGFKEYDAFVEEVDETHNLIIG